MFFVRIQKLNIELKRLTRASILEKEVQVEAHNQVSVSSRKRKKRVVQDSLDLIDLAIGASQSEGEIDKPVDISLTGDEESAEESKMIWKPPISQGSQDGLLKNEPTPKTSIHSEEYSVVDLAEEEDDDELVMAKKKKKTLSKTLPLDRKQK